MYRAMAVNYFLDKRPNKEGELPIRVQINVKGAKMLSTFGISVDPAVWSGSRVPKGTYRNPGGSSAQKSTDAGTI